MFLSRLSIDMGGDPDRERPGRLWVRNLYRVHQRLCMAFPSAARKSDDPDFLKPFHPADFRGAEPKQVHVKREEEAGFLFRVDPQVGGGVVILVQSATRPDWDYAFHNAGFLLAAPAQVKPFDPVFKNGEKLRFRLLANPTKRLRGKSLEKDGKPVAERWVGKRVALAGDKLYDWLARRTLPGAKEFAGFSTSPDSTVVTAGYVYFNKERNAEGKRLRSACFEGLLTVTDPTRFRDALIEGIGPAKAFGFGLLSVARIPS